MSTSHGRVHTASILFTLTLLLGVSRPLQGQDLSGYDQALAVSSEALSLYRSLGLDAALPPLTGLLAECPAMPDERDCRRVALYSIGYIYNQEAATRPLGREELLNQAAEYLQMVRSENPGFEPAKDALALTYRDMGHHEWQEPIFREMAEDDPTGRFSVFLGDYYRDQESLDAAKESYLIASELAPSDPGPRYRLLALFREGADLDVNDLVQALDEWAPRFPELAADGYRTAMQQLHPRDWRGAADLLPRWLMAKRGLDQVRPRLAEEIPEAWEEPPFTGLRRFLADPLGSGTPDWGGEEYREAVAFAALSLGHLKLAEGSPLEASAIWEMGLSVAPEDSVAWLELVTILAAHFGEFPELDPESARFDDMANALFISKGQAIRAQDFVAMARYHRTLSLLYARRGVWSEDWDPQGAFFQLTNAIEAAQSAQLETGLHQPMPEVHRLLGTRFSDSEDPRRARAAFLSAALAFLEVDHLGRAREMLDSVASLQLESGSSAAFRYEQVERWLSWREQARRVLTEPEEAGCSQELLDEIMGEVADPGPLFSPLTRQRFKALTACASVAPNAGARLYAETLQETMREELGLVEVADLLRFEDARKSVFDAFGQPVEPVIVSPSRDGALGTLPLMQNGEGWYVLDGAPTGMAARMALELQPWDTGVRLRFQGEDVFVVDPGELTLDDVVARLQEIAGIHRVHRAGEG